MQFTAINPTGNGSFKGQKQTTDTSLEPTSSTASSQLPANNRTGALPVASRNTFNSN